MTSTNVQAIAVLLSVLPLIPSSFAGNVEDPVTVRGPEQVTVTCGHGTVAKVGLTVAGGYHVQANPASRGLIATTVKITGVGKVSLGRPVYPKGRVFRMPGTIEFMSVYDGDTTIAIPVRASAAARPGKYVFNGTVEYQSCDSKCCFAPRARPLKLTVVVTAGRVKRTGRSS